MKRQLRKWLCLTVLLILIAAAYLIYQNSIPNTSNTDPLPTPTQTNEQASTTSNDDGLPHDKLFITVERQKYQDGELTLIIPKLEKELTVLDGIKTETLAKGVGLYDYSQLPGEGNRNVSIAGHRNGRANGKVNDNAPFYYIDLLQQGDYLYLRDKENIYRYLWDSCQIVEANDWGPIYSQGFSCLTLTSCHPIGVSDKRIIVRGRLDKIMPFNKDFKYSASKLISNEEVSK